MVYDATSPAEIGLLSAVFSTVTSGQFTVTLSESLLLPSLSDGSLLAVAEAVFWTRPQSAGSEVATMVTVELAPDASGSAVKVSTPPSIDQPLTGVSMAQANPAGSVSLRLTS